MLWKGEEKVGRWGVCEPVEEPVREEIVQQ